MAKVQLHDARFSDRESTRKTFAQTQRYPDSTTLSSMGFVVACLMEFQTTEFLLLFFFVLCAEGQSYLLVAALKSNITPLARRVL